MFLGELWKELDGENYRGYEVSTHGRVRNTKTGRIVQGRLNKANGYYRVNIRGKDEYTHRLVINTFKPTDKPSHSVRHIDGNRTNNALLNLEWIRPKYKK